jgi:hypothetical protein
MILSLHFRRASPFGYEKRDLPSQFLPDSAENPANAGKKVTLLGVFVRDRTQRSCSQRCGIASLWLQILPPLP